MMVRFIAPKPSQLICDPACGTAGFLISAAEFLRGNHEADMTQTDWDCFAGTNGATPEFTGFEIDQTMLRISAMNLMLHGVDMPDVRYLDSISKNNTVRGKYHCILANPPFTGSVSYTHLDVYKRQDLVMRPGTQVRSILHSGTGILSASEMDRMAFTVKAVPRMTVASSFTGMTTMPSAAAATYALNARRLSVGEQSMTATSKSPDASSSAKRRRCSRSISSFWSMRSIVDGTHQRLSLIHI